MKFSTVILYIVKYILRCGAILDLTYGGLERPMTWTTKIYHLALIVHRCRTGLALASAGPDWKHFFGAPLRGVYRNV